VSSRAGIADELAYRTPIAMQFDARIHTRPVGRRALRSKGRTTGAKRLLTPRNQLPQHIRQDAPVLVVLDLDVRIDSEANRHIKG
jgi:hypothetical protein